MANIVNQTIITEGTRQALVHWYFESDGNEGELNNYVLLDPALDFAIPIPQQKDADGKVLPPAMTVRKIWASLSWFDITLGFEGTVPNYVLPVARDADFMIDLSDVSGIKDRTEFGNSPTGRLIAKTKDFAPLGSNGFLCLLLRKD